ncbi:hypothetical protein SteCoe_25642 [Stentor coeruleus]|uniref:Protein kinase domain-containing protein n=1 Tax=Stentor coeruleus TaxID=5963 RepID=A0A1R2BEQ2_9CILI|nr:hypothetical protein SteCoe_25642 [Stentor coeruleus]
MGCCQTSTLSTSDQVCLYSHNDKISCQESVFDSINLTDIPIKPCTRMSEPPPRIYSSEDITSLYSLGNRISSVFYGERYFCIHNPSESVKEIIILKKLEMAPRTIDKILNSSNKIQCQNCENLVKIFYIGEDDKCINIVTEACSELNLADFIRMNKIQKTMAVKIIEQMIRGIMKYHECGIVLQFLTDREVFMINGQAKISPLVLLNSSSFTRAPESEVEFKNDVWSLGLLFLQIITSMSYIKNVQDVIMRLDSQGFDKKDLELVKSMFLPVKERCSFADILDHSWNSDGYINCGTSPKKHGISVQEYCFDKIPEEISDSPSIANEEESDDNEVSERIDRSSETSNDFYQSRELFDSHKSDNYEIADCDYTPLEWQEVDINSNGRIKICEILQEEMKEILESSPDHEESSLEERGNFTISPIEPNKTPDDNALSRVLNENPFLITDKSITNFTLTESPIFNDDDTKNPEVLTYSSPAQINEESKEISQELDSEYIKIQQNQALIISYDNILQDNKYLLPVSSLLIDEGIPTSSGFTESHCSKSANDKKSYSESAETSHQEIDEFCSKNHRDEVKNYKRSASVPKILNRANKVVLGDEKIVKENSEGKMKCYNFKKRCGVVVLAKEKKEVMLFEDDIVLSGIKMREIKNAIVHKEDLPLKFSVAEYAKNGICMLKAVGISIIDI